MREALGWSFGKYRRGRVPGRWYVINNATVWLVVRNDHKDGYYALQVAAFWRRSHAREFAKLMNRRKARVVR